MRDANIDFLYLSEQDMIKAGGTDMSGCIDTMEELFKLMSVGNYRMDGDNGNSHGIMMTFPDSSPFLTMSLNNLDNRFMAMPAYVGGSMDMAGVKWYGSNAKNKEKGLLRSILMLTLNDKDTGAPVACMSVNVESTYRTGVAPGVGVRHLARKGATTVGIIGVKYQDLIAEGKLPKEAVADMAEILTGNVRVAGATMIFLSTLLEVCRLKTLTGVPKSTAMLSSLELALSCTCGTARNWRNIVLCSRSCLKTRN